MALWSKRAKDVTTEAQDPERASSLNQFLTEYVNFQNNAYGVLGGGGSTSIGNTAEEVDPTFTSYVQRLFMANPVVYGCMLIRASVFSEARFKYRRRVRGRSGELFGTADLTPLEKPWPGGTTGQLLTRVIQDSDLAGNAFVARVGNGRLTRLRPDWVTIVLGGEGYGDPYALPVGYIYQPGGRGSDREPLTFLPEQVAHFAPIQDPLATYRGMSWLTPVLREVAADKLSTEHRLSYLEYGATPNQVVTLGDIQPEEFRKWVDVFEEQHGGVGNAYKTLFLAAGASVDVVGSNLKDADFKNVTALGENRIAVAAGVPGVIAGLSEGLESSTYSNFTQARRRFADGTIRPLWREVAGSFSTLVPIPSDAELWVDDTDIPFLAEDRKDEAVIQSQEATTVKTLVEAGYEPDSVVEAVIANDFTRLKHSGLTSVQLLPPGGTPTPEPEVPAANGNGLVQQ